MPSDRQSGAFGWQDARDEALRRIRARDWPPGALIPNEADLATEWGCARATVNRALRDLAEAGLLERRRKGGTRVVMTPLRKATLAIPVIRQEVEARGATHGYTLIERAPGPAPADVCRRMALDEGTRLLRVRALHLSDGAPHVYEDRWVNPVAVPAILDIDLARVDANAWLVQNVAFTRGDLALGAVAADAVIADALRCAPGSAVFTMARITWTGEHAITQVTQHYAPGYRLTTTF